MSTGNDIIDWLRKERGKDVLKVLSGIRGCGKTFSMRAFVDDLKASGVKEESIVYLDFEDAAMRHIKTHKDVLQLVNSRHAEGKIYLILDEITGLLDYEVLMAFLYGYKEFDIYVATSNSRLFSDEIKKYFSGRMVECRLEAPVLRKRSREELDRIWSTLFLRDVLGGHVLADATAQERLAEFLSDHIGENLSMRKISQSLVINEHTLHPNTISAYIDNLERSFLVKRVPIFDLFEEQFVNSGSRYFWTDMGLRQHRFGPSTELEEERCAYNSVFLSLRRKYRKVYCARSNDVFSDFVVFNEKNKPVEIKWKKF